MLAITDKGPFSYLLQDERCFTALIPACGNGHAKVVTTLINNGADVNYGSKVHTCSQHPQSLFNA